MKAGNSKIGCESDRFLLPITRPQTPYGSIKKELADAKEGPHESHRGLTSENAQSDQFTHPSVALKKTAPIRADLR